MDPDEDRGERRYATVMFADLSGYTSLNERLDPEDVSGLMSRVIAIARRIVEAHGGVVNQVVGDEVMALFGIPRAGKDDPARAVRAALALRKEMMQFAFAVAAEGGPRLAMHTSVHSGLILVRPGDGQRGRFSLTGDTVNTAARLLGLAAADEIVIGRSTFRAVASFVRAEPMIATPVRGKAEPLASWRVLEETGEIHLPEMVGRETERRAALSQLDACIEERKARLVVIRGEAGIGKSRLLCALAEGARLRGLEIAEGQVPDLGPSRGDRVWRQMALSLLNAADIDAATGRIDAAIAAGCLDPTLHAHLLAVADLPMPDTSRELLSQLDTPARERGRIDALASIAGWRSDARGLLLSLEDAHWAAAPALASFARLAEACRHLPVLLVVTTRPGVSDLESALRKHAPNIPVLTVDLTTLPDEAMLAMAGRLGQASHEVRMRCIERSGGNPLFLEQLLLSAEEGLRDGLPGSIQALVLARMDRLGPAHRAALQAASVLGQRVELQALRTLLDDRSYVPAPLVEAKLMRESSDGIEFEHALIRDGAYEALLKSRRRKLHARAAAWFAPLDPGLYAEHLDRAGSAEAAAAYLKACEVELSRFRYETALNFAQRGAALANDRATKFALAMREGDALRELGHNAEALQSFERARQLACTDVEFLEAWLGIGGVQRILSNHSGAMAALDAAQPLAERLADMPRLTHLHYLRGSLSFAGGRHDHCIAEHSRALELAEETGDLLGQAQALSGLADAAYLRGRMGSALELLHRCLDVADRAGARRFAVLNRAMKGWCLYWCGHAEEALREERAAGDEARALDHRNAMVMTGQSLGFVLRWMGRWTEAGEVNLRTLELAREVGARRFESIIAVAMAAVLRHTGDESQARHLAAEAWRKADESGATTFIGPIALLEVAHSTADEADRERLYAKAEAMLAGSVVSHCHVWLHADMIGRRLDEARYDEVLRHAGLLEGYVSAEPFEWATHLVEAGRMLVRFHRDGPRNESVRVALDGLHSRSCAIEHGVSRGRLAKALGAF